jgi:hypothetical protein
MQMRFDIRHQVGFGDMVYHPWWECRIRILCLHKGASVIVERVSFSVALTNKTYG